MPGDPLDGPVCQVLVKVLGLAVFLRRVIVPHNRNKLMHVRRHETVGMVETFPARPAMEGPRLRDLVKRRVIPLAQRVVHVTLFLQVVRNGLAGLGHDGVVARESHCCQSVAAQADAVRVTSGHQRRPRR